MIDIHSHILPGLDDGSECVEQSLEMLDMAAAAGTTDIVASPHANLEFHYDIPVVEAKIAELQALRPQGPRIHRGCDFHLIPENIEDALAHPEKYSINGKGYLLVEFSDLLIPRGTADIFQRMQAAGLVPVVTHPERNELLQRRLDEISTWVDAGCLLQVTGHSLMGLFGKPARVTAEQLMARRMVHFIASDAHDPKYRSPALDVVCRHITGRYGAAVAELLLVENPGAALKGHCANPMPLVSGKKKWFGLFG
jgi:protein-tyrosine phosphatase